MRHRKEGARGFDGAVELLALVALPDSDQLRGPSPAIASTRGVIPVPVTGGGLLAAVHPAHGLQHLFLGEQRIALGVELDVQGVPVPGSGSVRAGAGGWSREVALPGGQILSEVGFLCDGPAAAVIQWSLGPSGASVGSVGSPSTIQMDVRASPDGHGPPLSDLEIHLAISNGVPATVALLPAAPSDRVIDLLKALRAREALRAARGRSDSGKGLEILIDGEPAPSADQALQALDDAPLTVGPHGEPFLPFVAGFTPEGPQFLDPTQVAEIGRAALGAGRRQLSRVALSSLLESPKPPAASLLRLAAAWAVWTGDVGFLESHRPALERAGAADGIRLPTDLSTLKELLSAEPENRAPPSFPMSRQRSDFGPEGSTLRAAATIRDWVEGLIGAVPDATVGRVRIGPVVTESWTSFEAGGLAVDDARLHIGWRRDNGSVVFRIFQVGGRVPMNLIFEPTVVGLDVDHVRIGSEPADVDLIRTPDGTRIRCQFPLDPERELSAFGRS